MKKYQNIRISISSLNDCLDVLTASNCGANVIEMDEIKISSFIK